MKMSAVRAVRAFASLAGRCLRDEGGQDLLEYALLSAFIGLAGLAAFDAMSGTIGNYLGASDDNVNNIWESPNPGGS
jgi:Flp pilus assembly pilin Flp